MRNNKLAYLHVQKTGLAYCAGLLDGEGWIGLTKYKTRNGKESYLPMVTVKMTDRRPLDKVQKYLGGRIYQHKYKTKGGKIPYSWTLTCRQMARVLRLLIPYLELKKDVAQIVLDYELDLQHRKGKTNQYNQVLTPTEILRRRAIFNKVKSLNATS